MPGESSGSKCPHCKLRYSSFHRFKDHLQRDHLVSASDKKIETIESKVQSRVSMEARKEFEKKLRESMLYLSSNRRSLYWKRKMNQ